jgi:HAD superfamily hydrolase (TIGR01484 family)
MRYLVLATDFDGTLAFHGHVEDTTWDALRRLRESGRKAILVTGRELDDLLVVCPALDRFDGVVAENGGLLYWPARKEVAQLAETPPAAFVQALARRGVRPLSAGRTIVATVKPHEHMVLQVIREMGLELHIIFNNEAVMVLPSGINKATGLKAALRQLRLAPASAVSIGDAENDHAFLRECGCAAAVANALPAVQERADLVTRSAGGAGVCELIERLLTNDLADVVRRATPA